MKYQSKDRKLGTRQNIRMITDFLDARARTSLDVGCDEGMIAARLFQLGLASDAIEASAPVAEEAKVFCNSNGAGIRLATKVLKLEEVKAMRTYDIVCLLSVYHQIVEHNSIEYGNEFLVELYRKTNLQLFFQPCMIHLKHKVKMPFVENNTADALAYFSDVLRASGEPIHARCLGYSLNGLPASDPFRPMFLFEKKPAQTVISVPAMGRGRVNGDDRGQLLYINIEDAISAHALQSFSPSGWHHFTEACRAMMETKGDASIAAGEACLSDYYRKFQPARFGEIWRAAGLSRQIGVMANQPARHACSWLPWNQPEDTVADMRDGVTRAERWSSEDCHAYGPLTPSQCQQEARRLHGLLVKLGQEGYEPEVNHDGYLRGQLLVRGDATRFLVLGGQHRIAALMTLGYRQVLAKFQPLVPKVIDAAQVASWPQVANGTYSTEEALTIFNGIFEATGRPLRQFLETGRPALMLPAVREYRTAASLANGWSDQYGAIDQLAQYAGFSLGERYTLNAIWQHGCNPPWYDYSPDLLTNNTPNARELPVLVARREQEELLRKNGFARARAIGLPIIYVADEPVQRMPRSLLVMPTHTLAGEKVGDRQAFEKYADEIKAIAGEFDRVTICIHPSCRKNGLWVDEFSARGFEIVYGALANDLNALPRMRRLFESFETITTNGWGSHIAYALAFGAKVAIHGTKPVRDESNYLRDTAWAADPQALKTFLSEEIAEQERKFLAKFYALPTAGVGDVALGRWLVGADCRLSPEAAHELLAEVVETAAGVIVRARQARLRSRREAQQLLNSGAKGDAVRLLIRAVKADVASKNAAVILESLVEIGDELAGIEPNQSTYLLGEAEKIAKAQGLTLADMRARFTAA